jgi:hypothetical protein
MTLTDGDKIWIIGGFSSADYFSESVFVIDVSDREFTWTEFSEKSVNKPTGEFNNILHNSLFVRLLFTL